MVASSVPNETWHQSLIVGQRINTRAHIPHSHSSLLVSFIIEFAQVTSVYNTVWIIGEKERYILNIRKLRRNHGNDKYGWSNRNPVAANIGRTKWPTRREEGMKRDRCRDGSVRECESVCYDRATTGLQENPSTRSAPWRLGHPTIGPSGDTSGGMDFDSIRLVSNGIDSSRIDSTRLDSRLCSHLSVKRRTILLN